MAMSTESQRRFVIEEVAVTERGESSLFVEYVVSGDRVRIDVKDITDPFFINSLGMPRF